MEVVEGVRDFEENVVEVVGILMCGCEVVVEMRLLYA